MIKSVAFFLGHPVDYVDHMACLRLRDLAPLNSSVFETGNFFDAPVDSRVCFGLKSIRRGEMFKVVNV